MPIIVHIPGRTGLQVRDNGNLNETMEINLHILHIFIYINVQCLQKIDPMKRIHEECSKFHPPPHTHVTSLWLWNRKGKAGPATYKDQYKDHHDSSTAKPT